MISYRGYVYLIGSSEFGWYKIGQSRTVAIRIKTIGVLLPFKVEVFAIWKTDNPGRLEAAMHERHAPDHLNGEWFSFSWQDLSGIVSAETPYPSVRIPDKEHSSLYVANLTKNRTQPRPELPIPAKESTKVLLGGRHFGDWMKQYLLDSGLEKTPENQDVARREVLKLFQEAGLVRS